MDADPIRSPIDIYLTLTTVSVTSLTYTLREISCSEIIDSNVTCAPVSDTHGAASISYLSSEMFTIPPNQPTTVQDETVPLIPNNPEHPIPHNTGTRTNLQRIIDNPLAVTPAPLGFLTRLAVPQPEAAFLDFTVTSSDTDALMDDASYSA